MAETGGKDPLAERERAEARARSQFAARRRYKRARRRALNPFYLSPRSLALTLALVMLIALAGLALAVSLRADALPPRTEMVVEVVGVEQDGETGASPQTGGESADVLEIILRAETPAQLDLAGPAVPTVIVTDTPAPLTVGARAAVTGVGNDELNVRNIPTVRESEVLFRARAGVVFDIIGGPQQADGYSWWQVRDPQLQVQGWAVANYLRTIARETS